MLLCLLYITLLCLLPCAELPPNLLAPPHHVDLFLNPQFTRHQGTTYYQIKQSLTITMNSQNKFDTEFFTCYNYVEQHFFLPFFFFFFPSPPVIIIIYGILKKSQTTSFTLSACSCAFEEGMGTSSVHVLTRTKLSQTPSCIQVHAFEEGPCRDIK